MKWLDTADIQSSTVTQAVFWDKLRSDLQNGTFWADRIKQFRDQPTERLRLAIENLPLPAAFREAAIATRALIREQIKRGEDFKEELTLLYWLAAVNSFLIPYSEVLKEPGYNVIQTIPGKTIKSLPFTYSELGYEQLTLLKKTDVKWIEKAWGTPSSHSTLNKMHIDLWREFEEKLRLVREAEGNSFVNELRALLVQSRQ